MPSLVQRLAAEAVGTAFLLMAVVGSGIAAQRLSPGDVGLQLFENAVATAFALMALIWAFGPISGAHFNPAVTLADVVLKGRPVSEGIAYVVAQVVGGIAGTILANLMFSLDPVVWSTKERAGSGQWLGEVIATLGLLMVIFLIPRSRGAVIAVAVGAYIGAAYFFTSSTSFANPAVTVARMFSDTFAGIQPASAPLFILMQLVGAALAIGLVWFLVGRQRD
ncbi:MAG: aquaporin family protein [Chloroflexota bacterium]|nr:aquaporin family protein [Chloroflexota bacterium]MDE2683534.1 aquaporin family protein [Chloroflexota bacterium]